MYAPRSSGLGEPDMKIINKILTFAVTAACSSPAAAGQLDAFLNDLSGKVDLSKACVSIVDLRDPAAPARAGWRDTEIKPAASVIKLNLLAGAYNAVNGGVPFGSKIKITQNNWTGTWDPNYDGIPDPNPAIKLGETWTLEKLTEVMVRRSDNVATNTLIDFLDRKKVTDFVQGLGLTATNVRHKLSSGSEVADPDNTGYNSMPAHDAATLLMLIAQGKVVSPEASAAMYATLSGQLERDLIAAALPADAAYAGKTGELELARNDAAIVRAPGREYVLVVYTQLPNLQGKPVIQAVARAVDEYMRNGAR